MNTFQSPCETELEEYRNALKTIGFSMLPIDRTAVAREALKKGAMHRREAEAQAQAAIEMFQGRDNA